MKNDLNLCEMFEAFHQDLFRFLVKLTGDAHESEDILQDAYVRAYLKSALFNPEKGSLKNWVYKIAINIYYDRERFRAREEKAVSEYYEELYRETSANENENLNFEYSKEMINMALMMLAPDRRAIFLLSIKTPLRDIAEILSIAEGTVKSRLFYIRKELCANLKKIYEEENL